MSDLLTALLKRKAPVEAETEDKLVYPVLLILGWEQISVQQRMDARGRTMSLTRCYFRTPLLMPPRLASTRGNGFVTVPRWWRPSGGTARSTEQRKATKAFPPRR